MGESDQDASLEDTLENSVDCNQIIASLRHLGADRFDPIALHYLEVLGHRTKAQSAPVKRILEEKWKHALVAFELRFQHAQYNAKHAVTAECKSEHESLSDLIRHMAQHSAEYVEPVPLDNVGGRTELKSVRQFRNTWSTLSAQKQVIQALGQAPKNAGPINSHMLVLRSLALMRDISPDYLNRFVSYVDTLLCLDQGGKEKQTAVKMATATKSTAVRKRQASKNHNPENP